MLDEHRAEVPWAAALFALPLLYAFPGTQRLLLRHRWPVPAVQAATWVPFAVFRGGWDIGFGGPAGWAGAAHAAGTRGRRAAPGLG